MAHPDELETPCHKVTNNDGKPMEGVLFSMIYKCALCFCQLVLFGAEK